MITVYIKNDFGKGRDIEVYDVLAHSVCLVKNFAAKEKISCTIKSNDKNRGEIMIRSRKKTLESARPRWFTYAWVGDQAKIDYHEP